MSHATIPGVVALLALVALVAPALAAPRWLGALPPGAPTRMLATPRGLLLGSDAGLYRLREGAWTLVLTRGGVRDLARGAGETLIATPAGLFSWPDGEAPPRPLGLGAGARVLAVAVEPAGRVWAATEVGLFAREPGASRFLRDHSLPAGRVVGVRAAGDQVFAATRGQIWARGAHDSAFTPRLRSLEAGWWELRGAVAAEAGLLLAVPGGLWRLSEAGDERLDLGVGEVRGIARAGGRAWIACERGLLAISGDGTGHARGDAAGGEAFDVAPASDGILVASVRGIEVVPLTGQAAAAAPGLSRMGRERLDLPVLHRAVLSYQGLRPARIAEIEERARTAALLPEVRVAFGIERERDRERDSDQIFSSGARHDLRDVTRGSDRSLELSLQLTWDLDRHREPDRALAVSRERRELIELRDQVLERVNRLYFERRRVLAQLDLEPQPADAGSLEIKAHELAAQLDAWTGGLFSRLDANSPRRPVRTPP